MQYLNHRQRRVAAAVASAVVALLLAAGACGAEEGRRYSRDRAQASLQRLEKPGLVLGEFAVPRRAVIDGDTIKVSGLDTTLRLLAIDTEETFKKEADRRAVEADWQGYLRANRGDSPRPVKMATPMGEEAKKWAEAFFDGVDTVRLERDHPKEIRGRYNRYLVYVMARKDGAWVNYNLEAVRAGMTPYFTKYGFSRRFHDDFVRAEREARAARRGIWAPDARGYPDYDERKVWWDGRAAFIAAFEKDARGRDDMVVITNWDSLARIEAHMGKEITVLGSVSNIVLGDRGPTRVYLGRRARADFPVIFFDKDVFGTSGIAERAGEFVRVTGKVSLYRNRKRGTSVLQIVVERPGQVVGAAAEAAR